VGCAILKLVCANVFLATEAAMGLAVKEEWVIVDMWNQLFTEMGQVLEEDQHRFQRSLGNYM
jgi:hypothetical protein